jgi:ketosteroid isomerase-like protein
VAPDNVEIVRRMFDAFLRRDAEAALAAFHPEVEWDGTNLPDGGVEVGRKAVQDHVTRWEGMWGEWKLAPERFVALGDDRVAVLIRERGRSDAGLDLDELHTELYTLRDGLIVRRQAGPQARAALEAAEI